MGYYNSSDTLTIEGYQPPAGQPPPSATYNTISTDYFRTMQVPLLRGRTFTDADGENAQYVAILSEAMARKFWPDADPIGRQFQMSTDSKHSMVVVGIVKDVRYQGVKGVIRPVFYAPFVQHQENNSLQFVQVRTTAAPETMIPEIERTIDVYKRQDFAGRRGGGVAGGIVDARGAGGFHTGEHWRPRLAGEV